MVDLKKLQKDIYKNKVDKGFNVTDVNKEFCLTYGEVAEAYEAVFSRVTLPFSSVTSLHQRGLPVSESTPAYLYM